MAFVKGQSPLQYTRLPFARSKSTTSLQHKRQVRNKLAASPSTEKLRGNVSNGFWAYRNTGTKPKYRPITRDKVTAGQTDRDEINE